jgi:putative heme-binding domain-containing protein
MSAMLDRRLRGARCQLARRIARVFAVVSLVLAFWRSAPAQYPNVVTEDPLPAAEQQKKFHLPPGFEIQLVAAEPEVRKPINLNFDNRGRLFFSQSVEYPFPAKEAAGRDTVRIIEGFEPNGLATKITTFVDGLNIPIGVVPIPQGAIVYSIPNIYKCLDPGGTGRATERQMLYGPFQFRDTHGMNSSFTRGLDGWIYANHGYVNDDTVAGKDGRRITMQSGNTYRLKGDGSQIEYFAHGHVNPFGMTFDPLDNMYVSDCETLPSYLVLRGAYYPSFGKPHDGLGFGPPMMSHHHGPTAIAGIVYYAATQFPPEYRDTLFIGNPVSHRVCLDKLEWHGSSPSAIEQPDFIVCDDPWFRPVDLKLGPDGALYLADFYNRIIGHYEVPLTHPGRDHDHGRIWRIVYKGTKDKPAPPPEMPKPSIAEANIDQLIAKLADPNLVVRAMATNELVDRGGTAAIAAVRKVVAEDTSSPWQKAHGLWVLERVGTADDELDARLLKDPDRLVRVHMVKAIAERPDWTAKGALSINTMRRMLFDQDPFVCRAAAEALGRHPSNSSVGSLLDLWNEAPKDDTHLIHVVRIALREQLASTDEYKAMRRRGLPIGEREWARVSMLAEVSLGVPNSDSATFIVDYYLRHRLISPGPVSEYMHHVARYSPNLPEFFKISEALGSKRADASDECEMLRAIQHGLQERGGGLLPADLQAWAVRVADKLIGSNNVDQVNQGIELARELQISAAFNKLSAIVGGAEPAAARPAAIDTCVALDRTRSVALLGGLIGRGDEALAVRQKAAQALATISSDAARAELIRRLTAAPDRLAVEIAAGLAATKPGAELLLAAIGDGKASARLLREPTVLDHLHNTAGSDTDDRIKPLTAGLPPGDDRLNHLILERHDGFLKAKPDPVKGHVAFNKICAACHKIGDEGHKIGPQLDGIGVRGLDRLLEDVLDPNRNVDQAFRASLITTSDGRTFSGLVLREEGAVLVLADQQGKEIRIQKAVIADRRVQLLSPMPANVADLLSETEFYNLMSYLLAQQTQGLGSRDQGSGK